MAKNNASAVNGYIVIEADFRGGRIATNKTIARAVKCNKPIYLHLINNADVRNDDTIFLTPLVSISGTKYYSIVPLGGSSVEFRMLQATYDVSDNTVSTVMFAYSFTSAIAMTKPAPAPEIVDAPMIIEDAPEKVIPNQTTKPTKPRKAPTKVIPEQPVESEV